MRVLLAEDDKLLGNGIEAGLRQAGFALDWAQDGDAARLALITTEYSLLVLDLGLPKMSGTELLKWLRNRRNDMPVLILTARDMTADRIAGLEIGADDYMGKPFDLGELIARCRALLRRAHGRSVDLIYYHDLTIDPTTFSVLRDGRRIALTVRECTILIELLAHQGMALSRARLEESLYGWNEEIESNAIEVHISNLRKKLGADFIKTVRGAGYLIARAS
ncbi:MAG: response regulator [Burkholderiaceae bacterium]|nr:MAG: response regulator [Burkholderiaceae bacterium]TAM01331.1 MAG: response regulator [Pusillimonas sp.]